MALFDEYQNEVPIKSKPQKKKKKVPFIVVIVLAVLVLVGGLLTWLFISQMEKAASPSPSPNIAEAVEDDDGFAKVDWDYWANINPDVVGWVNVPGTDISQPICQAPEDAPNWYNYHDVYRNYNYLGCPFLYADNAWTGGLMNSRNAVVQGHNISGSGSGIFATFAEYANYDFANEHKIICVQTRDKKQKVEVFCAQVITNAASDKSLLVDFESDKQFSDYVEMIVNNSGVILSEAPKNQMWTFSTCSYFLTPSNERTVVHCKAV